MTPHDFIIANGDTDSISFKKPDQTPFTDEEQAKLLSEINGLMPPGIEWKNDKVFRRFVVLKAKNYVMDDGKKVKIKGSALKGSKKEPALKAFVNEVIELILKDKLDHIFFVYLKYARMIRSIDASNIDQWCFKVTVTKKVLEGEGAFQKKIRDAYGLVPVSEGDKVYLFFKQDGSLCLREDFYVDQIDTLKLFEKLHATVQVFANLFNVDLFPNFNLKRSEQLLHNLSSK